MTAERNVLLCSNLMSIMYEKFCVETNHKDTWTHINYD